MHAGSCRFSIWQRRTRYTVVIYNYLYTNVHIFVCATSKETSETVCLTSYRTPRGGSGLLNSVTIWEACRATSAATSFFDSIAIRWFGEQFVDGATGANNTSVYC
ncbi:hypothetical protein J3E74DRAFT_283391 [Bipolaris maydis]|nr:hypothetical protein J3E74DRAFT_283391 [Bipolaris maydis]